MLKLQQRLERDIRKQENKYSKTLFNIKKFLDPLNFCYNILMILSINM